MSIPTNTTAPPAPSGSSNPVPLRSWFAAISDWIKGLSPSGATVYDTGWIALTLSAGVTGSVSVRRIGRIVEIKGTVSPSTGTWAAGALVDVVPAGGIVATLRPTGEHNATCPSGGAGSAVARAIVSTDGRIRVYVGTIALPNVILAPLSAGWTVD